MQFNKKLRLQNLRNYYESYNERQFFPIKRNVGGRTHWPQAKFYKVVFNTFRRYVIEPD
jgi:hypothetical protein